MELPIYKIELNDTVMGLDAISLVLQPAVGVDFLAFSDGKQLTFSDDEKRIITGVSLLADTPIYRRSSGDGGYYVVFSKDVIKALVEKYFKAGRVNNISIEHALPVDNVTMVESYCIDRSIGLCPDYFKDIPDGSWITSFKVHNDKVWKAIKSGEVKGFSVQGVFDIKELIEDKEEFSVCSAGNERLKNINVSSMKGIKEAIKSLLLSFGEMVTDKAVLHWEGDAALKVGDKVMVNDSPAEDGEYKADGRTIIIKGGAVSDIVVDEVSAAVEEAADETIDEMSADEVSAAVEVSEAVEESVDEEIAAGSEELINILNDRIGQLEAAVEGLVDRVTALEAELSAIKDTPVVEPITAEFSVTSVAKTGNKMVDRYKQMLSAR